MANSSDFQDLNSLKNAPYDPLAWLNQNTNAATLILLAILAVIYSLRWLKPSPFRIINGKRLGELTNVRAKKEFMFGARQLIAKGLELAPGQPFRIMGDVGEIFILPPKYAYEIRNHDQLSFTRAAFKWFYAHLPGFEGFREGTTESHIMKLVARHQLTHQLTLVTEPVSEECGLVLKDIYTDDSEWHDIVAKEANLQLMARITSRVFLGTEMCRNPQWLRITTTYAVVAFRAVEELRLWPSWLRPVVQWFMPHCTAARALVQEARGLINPLLERRRIEKTDAQKRGEKVSYNDAIEWLEQTAQEKKVYYDPACAQLSLSVAALHSTTDFFTQVMLDIAKHPELVEPLREEVISVLSQHGWSKHSLYKLKLMDSVLKESQRLKPISIASMRRMTTADVKLSDGTVLPKDKLTLVSAHKHWDAESYENPDKFDGYRFYKMREEPGKENKAQLVSVSPDHMGFGFGLHACPGRFFASEEIKLALCHILLKYDFKPVEGSSMEPRKFGLNINASPTAKLSVRRRKEEITI
ncbi:gibberellin cluster-GA14-synthase [Fusarium albosuccineum]|uniref:Gibberellin cluster-GA14-synthase n=1 Tax=Fusarium albosuccineum TaxID=1237068 RepID=A0A8H4LMT0_9HYPO|nr:gibberellin cluster-GA14-synthase [Fusarium albosuccineum]